MPTMNATKLDEGQRYWCDRWDKKRALIELGMADLSLWLRDQASLGIEQLRREGSESVKSIASRMLNVECKGIAERLERLAELVEGVDVQSEINSAETFLDAQILVLGELALLSSAFEQFSQLSFEQQVSLLTTLGLGEEPKSVRIKPELDGRWVALTQQIQRERGLLVRRQWFCRLPSHSELQRHQMLDHPRTFEGIEQRKGLVLSIDYAWGRSPLPPSVPLAGVLKQALRPFEGVAPQRALIYPIHDEEITGSAEYPYLVTHELPHREEWLGLLWSPHLEHSRTSFEQRLCETPWHAVSPALISGCRVINRHENGTLLLLDRVGATISITLPVPTARLKYMKRLVLCIAGRGPVFVVGEWHPHGFNLLSLISEQGRLFSITGGKIA